MLELKDKCVHPETSKPYLKMGMGGINNSPEGIGVCFTYLDLETAFTSLHLR